MGEQRARHRPVDRPAHRLLGQQRRHARPGIASTDQAARPAWSDTRLAAQGANTQDLFAATVQLDEVPGEADAAL